MTIVFKYGAPGAPGNVGDRDITGVASWATVATPYKLTKNLPDFMVFEVSACRPRLPINTATPEVVPPGTKFPAYRVRVVGGPNEVPAPEGVDSDQPTFTIPPHSEIWAVSGIFPPFATNPPPVHQEGVNATALDFRDRNGLIGDLKYPTPQDIAYFSDPLIHGHAFPTGSVIGKGPGTFLGTKYPNLDTDYTWMIQYEVSCSDFQGGLGGDLTGLSNFVGGSPISNVRLNQSFFLPPSWDSTSNAFVVELLEENNIRKVIRVKATTPTQGFNIWTYYYKYFNSPTLLFSTRIHWSDRNPIPGTTSVNNNPLIKRVHQIMACTDSPIDIFQKEITMPKTFGTGGNAQHAHFAPPTIVRNTEQETRRPILVPERARDLTNLSWNGIPNNQRYPYPIYLPLNPNYGQPVYWGYSYKVYGDEEIGTNIFVGPTGSTELATSAVAAVTTKQKWMREGSGHYFYGVLYGVDETLPNPFEKRDYYLLRQFGDVGAPEGTYIWSEGECV